MPKNPSKRRARLGGGTMTLLGVAGGLGALALANRLIARHARDTFSVLSGESRRYAWTAGDVFYKVKGQGEPLVLVHGIYAGASGFEWRKNVDVLAEHFRVYVPDLPGYGLSSRPPLKYTAEMHMRFLIDFIREVAGGADRPVQVIASSLSAAHLIKAAFHYPRLFERLVLIEPAGVYALSQPPNVLQRVWYQVLRVPVLGQSVYNAVASRAALRSYLTRCAYLRPESVTDDLVDYYYTTAHQPGARYAPLSFLTGYAHSDIAEVFARLPQPTLLIWGKQAKITPATDAQAFQRLNPRAEVEVIDGCRLLPHDEQADRFHEQVLAWLRQPASARP